ncbi:uncharacterized protein C11orf98 homolog [Sylvia borin]
MKTHEVRKGRWLKQNYNMGAALAMAANQDPPRALTGKSASRLERMGGAERAEVRPKRKLFSHEGGAMGIGGKINRPRTELRKKLFKRRRELARGRRQKRRSLSVPAVPAPVWGKRRRKELKRLRGASKRALQAAVTEAKKPQKEVETGDVEMAEVAPE